jgi:hypothetical protein
MGITPVGFDDLEDSAADPEKGCEPTRAQGTKFEEAEADHVGLIGTGPPQANARAHQAAVIQSRPQSKGARGAVEVSVPELDDSCFDSSEQAGRTHSRSILGFLSGTLVGTESQEQSDQGKQLQACHPW